ncbi:SIS domain-containing protein [Salana multivorans]
MSTIADRRRVVLETARAVVTHEAEGVAASAADLDDVFLTIVQRVYECTGKVFVTGAGTSGAIARRMAHLLSVSGTPSMFIHGADALHGTMGAMAAGDILIAISRGGGSQEINDLVQRARERGVDTVIALTADRDSALARGSDLVVVMTMLPGIDPGEVIAMGSTLVTAAWGDALAVVLMRMRGYSWSRVLHSHPSGAVGRIEHAPEELPALPPFWE